MGHIDGISFIELERLRIETIYRKLHGEYKIDEFKECINIIK